MHNKRLNTSKVKSVIRIAETPSSHSQETSERYLKNVLRESDSLLDKLSTLPDINDYKKELIR